MVSDIWNWGMGALTWGPGSRTTEHFSKVQVSEIKNKCIFANSVFYLGSSGCQRIRGANILIFGICRDKRKRA